jgi:predicted transcriptional regulator
VDKEIFLSEYFIFNPSDPEKSIRISTDDLKTVYENIKNDVRYFTHEEDYFEISDNV